MGRGGSEGGREVDEANARVGETATGRHGEEARSTVGTRQEKIGWDIWDSWDL